mmetsp:Transcript_35512/g.69898  ORF Transcript_35512/g.69898 Transcript_35512/m.69898 type:complete len:401 (+) Transcript_35512:28-1230(+)
MLQHQLVLLLLVLPLELVILELQLCLVELLDARIAHKGLETEKPRPQHAGVRHQRQRGDPRHVQQHRRHHEVLGPGGRQGHPFQRLLVLQRPHPDLEAARLHGPDGFFHVGNLAGGGDGRVEVALVEARRAAEYVQVLREIGFVPLLCICKDFHERLRELPYVVRGIQPLPDPVHAGKRSKNKCEGARKPEGVVLREGLQVRPHRLLDVRSLFSDLLVLEGPHEVPRQFFHGEPVRSSVEHAGLLHAVHEHLGIFGEVDVADHGSPGEEGGAEFPEAGAHFGFELVHHAEIVVDQISLGVDAQVAGVWVAVKVARLDDLFEERVRDALRHQLLVESLLFDPCDVGELERFDVFHGEDPGGGDLPDHVGDAHPGRIVEIFGKSVRVIGLVDVIDFLVEQFF